MKKYYFTFGHGHYNRAGVLMKDYYVTVLAGSYEEAREEFIKSFSSIVMPAPNIWAFQYEEDKFRFGYFPLGQYALVLAKTAYAIIEALSEFYPEGEINMIEKDGTGKKLVVYGPNNIYGLRWEIMDTA